MQESMQPNAVSSNDMLQALSGEVVTDRHCQGRQNIDFLAKLVHRPKCRHDHSKTVFSPA